ncbi:COMM domain-containing protein 8-like protein, partial [Dinothrombium tinctorium]
INIDVNEETQKAIYECIEVRRVELKNAITNMIINETCPQILTDFDWQLKMILASDKMADINEPILNLDLKLKNSKMKHSSKNISFEMNKEELKNLITKLEEAHSACKA